MATQPTAWIQKGTRVKIVDWPGTALRFGDIGTAEESPSDAGLFWAVFNGGRRHHVRMSEVMPA